MQYIEIKSTKNLIGGERVVYKDEMPNADIFRVYAVYGKYKVSLGLREYPDCEQDFMVNVKNLLLVKS